MWANVPSASLRRDQPLSQDTSQWGSPTSVWRRLLGVRRSRTWHDDHPLPAGWRPRTRVTVAGVQVEPWVWLAADAVGFELDGGERWLPMGRDPDEAAYEILDGWIDSGGAGFLEDHELAGVRVIARHAHVGSRVGVAYAGEAAISA